jgi:methylenetetrahydrofolate dehydrogenase (NADP+)/methenyltetrahydrofolate cyclohydrolase
MELLDGRKLSREILEEIREKLENISGPRPCVTFIRVGEDPASVYYVNSKQKKAAQVGIESRLITLDETISQEELLERIRELNADPSVHGILVDHEPRPARAGGSGSLCRLHTGGHRGNGAPLQH